MRESKAMQLVGFSACVDYSDFLAETLPINLPYFDHYVVVTHHTDKKTIELCNKYSVTCVQTHAFYEDGDKFNKYKALNLAMAHLRRPEWILHLDADVVLPHRFRDMLDRAKLDTNNIYGADRVNIQGYDHWQKIKQTLNLHYAGNYFVESPAGYRVGARIVHHEHGYAPVGYFQLWHKNSHKKYPINQGTAEHGDLLFAIQWARNQRILLPEVFVYHLDSRDDIEQGYRMGANWNGRTTPEFSSRGGGGRGGKHHHHHHAHVNLPYKPKPPDR